jgi:CRP-like cAMP-binding protein
MQYSDQYIEQCLEAQGSVFRNLSDREKSELDKHHIVTQFKRGDLIFNEGDKARGLVSLVSGKAKVFKIGIGGREQILKMVKPNGFIGYRSLFSESNYSISASAIEDAVVVFIEKSCLIEMLKKNADFAYQLMKVITDDLTFTVNRTLSLTQKHIRGRLAESLLVLRDTYGMENDGKTIRVALSREDIANLSNMTTSNAIRTLSSMVTENIIEMEGRKIRIKDLCELERISTLG